jgi:putative ABC transport system permease protein
MEVLADFRIAARGLWRSKGFAIAGAITLALGIAATTTIFSVVYGVLLRPLPYRDADRLVVIQGEKDFSTGPRLMNYSGPELEEFAAASTAFSPIAITASASFTLRNNGGVESISGATVSQHFFDVLGTAARLGRTVAPEAEPSIVISDRLWRRLYGGTPDVVGKHLVAADATNVPRAYTIVGVMPPEFQYPSARTDFWRPLAFARTLGPSFYTNRNGGGFLIVARMRSGVSLDDAQRDAARTNEVLKPNFNGGRTDMRAKVVPFTEFITSNIGPALWILLGTVALVLLVACTNVANLILARQSSRSREIAMRMALGAPRRRLVGYAVIESAIVTLAGTAIGVAIAFGAIRLLQWIQPSQLPRLDAVAIDLPVLAFAIGVAVVAVIGAGLAPAILTTRTDAVLAIRAGSRSVGARHARWLRSSLVVIEIAASIVLLVGAALLGRSLLALIDTDLGVNTENVIAAQLDMALGRNLDVDRQAAIADDLLQRISAIPTVRAAGFGTGVPPTGEFLRVSFVFSNANDSERVSHIVTSVPVSPGYFTTLQIPLLRGRYFDATDNASADSLRVIVNREAARRFFGHDYPVGRTLPMGQDQMTVVGVVENVKYTGVASRPEPVLYRPFAQSPFRIVVLFARTIGEPQAIAGEIRQVIQTYDRDISITNVQPLTTWLSTAVAQPRFRALLLSTIALITLVLAMVGLYGVISYSTSQRTSEIGLRVAIGAQRGDVIRLVLAEGARLAVAGIVVGMISAYWATRLLSSFLYGVTATDLPAFAVAALALFIVALVATYLPAHRAARVDPMHALRAE